MKIKDIVKARVLVIGDLMLDRFTYGDVIRISPEAPVPVLHVNLFLFCMLIMKKII